MEHQFWHKRWQNNEIGFHEKRGNRLLVKHFEQLGLPKGSRILVPLCGKTHDIGWLLSQGYNVVGVELVEDAIVQLFEQLGVTPIISQDGSHIRYAAHNIDILVGDFFNLSKAQIGSVDAIYDRAALVALPQTMRDNYTQQLIGLTNKAKQLLITFDYDQSLVEGPPFAISPDTVSQYYQADYDMHLLEDIELYGGLKGQYPAREQVWLLKP